MAVLTPDGLSRKTMRDILIDNGVDVEDYIDDITIGCIGYNHKVMEDSYDKNYQISAKEGDLIFFSFITYGYGESIEWDRLEAQKNDLEQWAINTCGKHNCTFKIKVTANHW